MAPNEQQHNRARTRVNKRYRFLQWSASAACLWLLTTAAVVQAAELRWRNRSYTLVAEGKKVGDFIRELAASQGVTAVVDPKVEGTINGKFSGPPASTLNTVCATYGLTWYYDGSLIYVDRADDSQTQVFPIPKGSGPELVQILRAMQITDQRFPLVVSDKENTVYASGPKRYVELVRQAIASIADPSRGADRAEIRAFPLKYAWAGDVEINRSGKPVTIPGIATMMRRLLGAPNPAASSPGMSPTRAMRLTGPTRQMKLSSGDSINVPRIEIPLAGAQGDSGYGAQAPAASGGGAPPDLPRIEADAGINAVLIRDVPEHMAQYERLIASLDTKPRLVEINLTIIDISTDSLDSLGVDWRLHTTHGDFQSGNGNNPPLTFNLGTTEDGQTGATTPIGMALTASIGGSLRNYLLARINALTQSGNAQLQAKPKVLALDNTEAILENLIHFYVPVSGFQDASLYGITTGTSVKVTPLIVNEAGQMSVMMSIDIDDGNLTNDRVSQLPVVQERSIVTKAMIEEGKSLLIAGFNSDSLNNTKSGIPLLSDVPFIGNLFKYTNKTGQHMERFYLLTPRILTAASTNPNDVPAVSIPGVGMPVPGSTDWKPGPLPNTPAPNQPPASVGALPTPPVSRLHEPASHTTLAALG